MNAKHDGLSLKEQSWLDPPKTNRGKRFDIWCYAMYLNRFRIPNIAERLGVSETYVTGAIRRVQCGRYPDIK